jgi:phosphoribosyl 1,2-cyclic phosphate phosphodiesterase
MLEITVLGCGASAGVPMIGGADGFGDWGECDPAEPRNRRTRSSIVVRAESGRGERLLVDTGPDLRAQLLACGVPSVEAILFTHAHADHIIGLDEVRILNRIAGRPLPAFANAQTAADLARRFDYAFRPWQPPGFFRPVLDLGIVAPGERVRAAGMDVLVFDQDHGRIRTLGVRIGGFGYSTDVVTLDAAALVALEGVDTWLVGCFQRAPHHTHAWLERVLEWRARLAPRRTVLTHLGVDMDWGWLARHLPEGVSCAYDGMVMMCP